jgi:hypothetical protein
MLRRAFFLISIGQQPLIQALSTIDVLHFHQLSLAQLEERKTVTACVNSQS